MVMPLVRSVDMVRRSGESPTWYAPVPQESIRLIRGCEGVVRDWKTPSAMVERPLGGLVGCVWEG